MEIKINIWDECWIPDNHSRRIMTVRGNQVLTKVSELISPMTGEWDEELERAFPSQSILMLNDNTKDYTNSIVKVVSELISSALSKDSDSTAPQ